MRPRRSCVGGLGAFVSRAALPSTSAPVIPRRHAREASPHPPPCWRLDTATEPLRRPILKSGICQTKVQLQDMRFIVSMLDGGSAPLRSLSCAKSFGEIYFPQFAPNPEASLYLNPCACRTRSDPVRPPSLAAAVERRSSPRGGLVASGKLLWLAPTKESAPTCAVIPNLLSEVRKLRPGCGDPAREGRRR
eukprot:320447-Chlamydomonas_euryale.AAC.6